MMINPPAQRRILIITSGPLCQNPRPLKEALSLDAAGHAVIVLTAHQSVDSAKLDQRLIAGTKINMEIPSLTMSALGRLWVRGRIWLARKLITHLRWNSPWILGPVYPLLKSALNIPADLTIVHNEAPFWVGVQLIKKGRKVAADFEDWYSEDLLPSARRARPLKLIRQIEWTLLHHADYCTTTSQAMAHAMAKAYAAKSPGVIPNCFPLQPTPELKPSRPPELVWFSQTTGPGRGLEEFITHWGRLNPAIGRLTLIGNIVPGFDQTLLELLPFPMRDRVTFSAPVPPDELPSTLTRFDVGLALEHRDPPNKDLTTSNKIFQYFNAGLAVIATPTAGQKEVMPTEPAVGIVVDLDSANATEALAGFLSHTPILRSAQQAARRLAESQYHWEKFAPSLVDLVAAALNRQR